MSIGNILINLQDIYSLYCTELYERAVYGYRSARLLGVSGALSPRKSPPSLSVPLAPGLRSGCPGCSEARSQMLC